VIHIKGTKARIVPSGIKKDNWILEDVDAKQVLLVKRDSKEVENYFPDGVRPDAPPQISDAKFRIKALGQTKPILGHTCAGYTYSTRWVTKVPAKEITVTMTQTGVFWLAKDGPDVAEWRAFSKAAAAAGVSGPGDLPGVEARALAELQKVYAEDGIPLELERHITVERYQSRVQTAVQTSTSSIMTVTAISTDPVPDEMIVVPAGYTKK
jgi:hypothetical protein